MSLLTPTQIRTLIPLSQGGRIIDSGAARMRFRLFHRFGTLLGVVNERTFEILHGYQMIELIEPQVYAITEKGEVHLFARGKKK